MWRAAVASLILVLILPVYARGQQVRTLAEVLKQNSIYSHLSSVQHLNDQITSYATLNNEREFLIAYYLVTPRNELRFPILLARFDKQSNKWQEASFTGLKVKAAEGTAQADC